MKPVFAALLVVLSLLSLLAWAIAPRPLQDGRTTLVWTVDDTASRQQQAELFEELHPQYRLLIDANNMDQAKVIVQSLAGVGPDLFCAYSGWMLSAFVKSGIAWDITDELAARGVNLDDHWNGPFPCMIYDGRIYGLGNNAGVDALWFHKDVFDEAGLPYPEGPWTWDDFLPLAQQLTIRDERGRVQRFGLMFEWYAWPMFMRQFGGSVYNEDGTRCVLDSPETIAAIQFMQDLVHVHGVAPTPEDEVGMAEQGGWGRGAINLFGAGRSAMALGGRWWLMSLRRFEGLRLGAVESPHGPYRVYHSYGKSTCINKHSPRRKEALDFLLFLASQEHNELINHQGDALGPVKEYAHTDLYLNDPAYPEEDFNHVWRDVMQYGVPEQSSLFVNGAMAHRIMREQLDLVKINAKSAADAMRDAAQRINDEIDATLRREPELRQRFQELVAQRKGSPHGHSAQAQ